jgi:hypothetical protein
MKLTQKQHHAMLEYMRRPTFASGVPSNFWHDICSEGLTENDGKAIFREIARRLKALSAMYDPSGSA